MVRRMACGRVFFLVALVSLGGCEPAVQAPVDGKKRNDAAAPPIGPVETAIATAVVIRSWAADQLAQAREEREFYEEAARVVLPVERRHRKPALTREWLAGYWVDQKFACSGSDSGLWLEADGRWQDYEESGTWSIAGSAVTTKVTEIYNVPNAPLGETESFRVRLVGPNEIDTLWQEGAGLVRLYRCPEGGMPGET